jgi:hypothetical protein
VCVVMTGNQEPVSCDITNQVSVPLLVGARCYHHESWVLHPAASKVEMHVSSVANVLGEYNHICWRTPHCEWRAAGPFNGR